MSDLLKKIIEAVVGCREILLSPFSVSTKDSVSNLVTSADKAVEEKLKTELLKILPDACFLGEEGSRTDDKTYRFVVDPIDGTANFVRNLNCSAISVGLLKDGVSVLGVVYNPFTNELYYAEKGKGAFLNGQEIRVSNRDFAHSLYYTALCIYKKELAENCLNILREVYQQCDDFRREGSAALELCRLASGKAELYFEIRIFPWDSAAAEVILTEAGGVFKRLYAENIDIAAPFPIIAANNAENLEKLEKIVVKEVPRLPKDYN